MSYATYTVLVAIPELGALPGDYVTMDLSDPHSRVSVTRDLAALPAPLPRAALGYFPPTWQDVTRLREKPAEPSTRRRLRRRLRV